MNTRNVLSEFFNSSSDANEFLEAHQQEKLENAFQKYLDSKQNKKSSTDVTMQASEWAKASYKLLPNEDNDEATRQWNYKIYDQRSAAERGYLAGAAGAIKWVPVSERLPSLEDCNDTFDEVLTMQIGRSKPILMNYWEIKHCPFTSHWMKLTTYPSTEERIAVKTLPPHPEKEQL